MTFTDPIIGGESKLIRQAIQSPDYQAGLTGWSINRDGTAEFNDATIRGELSAGGGTVVVNELGIYVTDDNSDDQYVILRDGGFVARNIPDDGAHCQMFAGGLSITRPTLSPNGFTSTRSRFDIQAQTAGTEDFIISVMATGTINGKDDCNILLRSAGSNTTVPLAQIDATVNGTIDLLSNETIVENILKNRQDDMRYIRGQTGSVNVTFAAAGAASVPVVFPNAFPAGVTPYVDVQINSGAAQTARWMVRANSASNTGFTLLCLQTDNADGARAWANVPVVWSAIAF